MDGSSTRVTRWERDNGPLGLLIIEIPQGRWYWNQRLRLLLFVHDKTNEVTYEYILSHTGNTRERAIKRAGRFILAGVDAAVNPGDIQW